MMDNFSTNRASFCGGAPLATSSRSRTPYILLLLCVICVATCFGTPLNGKEDDKPLVTARGTKPNNHPPSITAPLERHPLLAIVSFSGIPPPQSPPNGRPHVSPPLTS